MNFVLLVVVILIAIAIVAAAIGIAKAIAPRSYNPQKGEAYECGIPTRGKSWMQFKVGYYLFAILFLMFDVETVFLFAWANLRPGERTVLPVHTCARPCIRMAEGCPGMEVDRTVPSKTGRQGKRFPQAPSCLEQMTVRHDIRLRKILILTLL